MATARGIANRVASTIRKALKVKSPSRITEDIGGFVTEGLGVGMLDLAGKAVKAAQKVSGLVSDAFDPELAMSGVPEMQPLDIAGQVSDINKQASKKMDNHLTSEMSVSKQPAHITLQLGSSDFETFVEDINEVNAINTTLRRF